jgi:multidrug resistance efflux pump
MISRRSALKTAALGAAAIGSTAASPELGANDFSHSAPIRAPKDGFVTETLVASGAAIDLAQPIIQMDTSDEDRMSQRLVMATSLVEIEKKSLSLENIHRQRKSLELAKTLAESYVKLAEQNKTQADADLRVGFPLLNGTTPAIEAMTAQVRLDRAHKEVERTKIALENFDFAIAQAKSRQETVDAQIKAETDTLKFKKDMLTLKAPAKGRVNLTCIAGQFVMKGDILANVTR